MTASRHDSSFPASRFQRSLNWLLALHLLAQSLWPALLPPVAAAAPPVPPLSGRPGPAGPALEARLPGLEPPAGPGVLTETLFLPALLRDGSRANATAGPSAGPVSLYLPLLSKSETAGLDFSAAPLSGPTPLRVTFTPRATGPAQTLTWKLGDGTILTGSGAAAVSHTYRSAGSYDVVPAVAKAGLVVVGQAKPLDRS